MHLASEYLRGCHTTEAESQGGYKSEFQMSRRKGGHTPYITYLPRHSNYLTVAIDSASLFLFRIYFLCVSTTCRAWIMVQLKIAKNPLEWVDMVPPSGG